MPGEEKTGYRTYIRKVDLVTGIPLDEDLLDSYTTQHFHEYLMQRSRSDVAEANYINNLRELLLHSELQSGFVEMMGAIRLCIDDNMPGAAIEALKKLQTKVSPTHPGCLLLADVLFVNGHSDEALEIYATILWHCLDKTYRNFQELQEHYTFKEFQHAFVNGHLPYENFQKYSAFQDFKNACSLLDIFHDLPQCASASAARLDKKLQAETILLDKLQVEAMHELARCYDSGRDGFKKDEKEAAKWYEAAAVKGLPCSMFAVASCYEYGDGVPQDIKKAREWYQKAADRGVLQAVQWLKSHEKPSAEATSSAKATPSHLTDPVDPTGSGFSHVLSRPIHKREVIPTIELEIQSSPCCLLC